MGRLRRETEQERPAAYSPGQRTGYDGSAILALKGQKHYSEPVTGDEGDALFTCFCPFRAAVAPLATQGDALGYVLIAPSGRYRVVADNHLTI